MYQVKGRTRTIQNDYAIVKWNGYEKQREATRSNERSAPRVRSIRFCSTTLI